MRRRIGRRERRRRRERRWWRRRHERHYYVLFSVRSVESGGRGKRILKIFQRLPKEDFKRVQLCGKERDKKEDTKRHSTRRKEHTDTVYARVVVAVVVFL